MIKWMKDLVIGKGVGEKKAAEIMKKLDSGKMVSMYYLITLSSGSDMLEIINTSYLAQSHAAAVLPPVVGIAVSRSEAKQMALELVDECFQKTGGADVKAYLAGKF
ncbi:MAG: hypothetical protein K6E30_08495 [Lachnospiraceae bacterium]|nr:hypothetical protein [Lachnospiraceae bacterium]